MKPIDVPDFVKGAPIVVLHVGLFAPKNDLVLDQFRPKGTVAWVDWNAIEHDDPATRWWINVQHQRFGWGPDQLVRMGYYVFVDGEACGYHPGAIDFENDRLSIGLGLASFFIGLASDDARWFKRAATAAQIQAASRVNAFFDEQIARAMAPKTTSQTAPPPPRPPPPRPPADEVTASAITSNPATRRHLKTVHSGRAGTEVIYCAADALGKFAA